MHVYTQYFNLNSCLPFKKPKRIFVKRIFPNRTRSIFKIHINYIVVANGISLFDFLYLDNFYFYFRQSFSSTHTHFLTCSLSFLYSNMLYRETWNKNKSLFIFFIKSGLFLFFLSSRPRMQCHLCVCVQFIVNYLKF